MTGLGGQSFEIVSFHYGEMWRGVEGAKIHLGMLQRKHRGRRRGEELGLECLDSCTCERRL